MSPARKEADAHLQTAISLYTEAGRTDAIALYVAHLLKILVREMEAPNPLRIGFVIGAFYAHFEKDEAP